MNYDYSNLWELRKQFKALGKIVNRDGIENGFAINKYLEIKRDIIFLKRKLKENDLNDR